MKDYQIIICVLSIIFLLALIAFFALLHQYHKLKKRVVIIKEYNTEIDAKNSALEQRNYDLQQKQSSLMTEINALEIQQSVLNSAVSNVQTQAESIYNSSMATMQEKLSLSAEAEQKKYNEEIDSIKS